MYIYNGFACALNILWLTGINAEHIDLMKTCFLDMPEGIDHPELIARGTPIYFNNLWYDLI